MAEQTPTLSITTLSIKKLKPAEYNPRKIDQDELQRLATSIKEFGFVDPVIVNKDMTIIGGHQRVKAAKLLGWSDVPCNVLDLTKTQERVLNLALNKISGRWDEELLTKLLQEIKKEDALELTGFSEDELKALENDLYMEKFGNTTEDLKGSLNETFIVPPFSVLDSKQGYWRARKRVWDALIDDRGETRTKAGTKYGSLLGNLGKGSGISLFDPVLAEVCYRWFSPNGASILDPFAGGACRGLVASMIGKKYTGIDLRPEQIAFNGEAATRLKTDGATWHAGNSNDMDDILAKDDRFDMVFTCPPYYDLEEYSDDPKDLSNLKTYEDFLDEYKSIFIKAAARLKENRFLVVVVGDLRDKKGKIRNFVGDNVRIMQEAGLMYYNEIILATPIGASALRARRNFRTRKVTKLHQNVLIFFKGQEPDIGESMGAISAEMSASKVSQTLKGFEKVLVFFKGDADAIKGDFPVDEIGDDVEFQALLDQTINQYAEEIREAEEE